MASITNLLCFKPSPEPEVTYLPIPADDEHFHRINHLSIEAPLLLASVPPRTTDLPRSLRELPRAFKPTRFRLLPTSPNAAREERPAFYFEILHVDVYANARRFVNMHFGYGDVPYLEEEDEDEGHSLWVEGRGFPKEFLRYASLVARQDNLLGGWEALLRNEKERTTMLCGIIARALEDGAWDRLLFGANEEQERLLDEMDAGTIRCEGYERTALRTQTINTLLGTAPLPPNFWPEVDTLTTRILTLTLPLLDLLDTYFPASQTNPLAHVHQDLHRLVSLSAFSSLALARSASIFRHTFAGPGSPPSAAHLHDPASESVYTVSRAAAEEDEARERGVGPPCALPGVEVAERGVLTGKVKICVWPGLERWSSVEGGEGGEEVVRVGRERVVYYCGRAGEEEDGEEGRPGLGEYVADVRVRNGEGRWWVGQVSGVLVWLVAVVLVAVWVERCLLPVLRGEGGGEGVQYRGCRTEAFAEPQTWNEKSVFGWIARIGRIVCLEWLKEVVRFRRLYMGLFTG